MGNYELMDLLLRFGANVNYYARINTTHFPSALQYAFKDEVSRSLYSVHLYWRFNSFTHFIVFSCHVCQVILRMLCNYGYNVERCFDCPYGNKPHIPEDYEGWSDSVIKDTMVI